MEDKEFLIGKKFYRYTIIKRLSNHKQNGGKIFLCKCDCGNYREKSLSDIKNGRNKSCGCLAIEKSKIRSLKHGMYKTRLYNIWDGMKARATNLEHRDAKNYILRGVSITKEWLVFSNFKDWALQNGYKKNLTLDRIDNNKGYYPENCRWTTFSVQSRNKRSNVFITYNNETLCLSDWAKKKSINRSTLSYRLKHWGIEKALTTPVPL